MAGPLGHEVLGGSISVWDELPNVRFGDYFSLYPFYLIIGQSLMTLVVALLGGLIGRCLARQRPDERTEPA
jgi:hypothetical protein